MMTGDTLKETQNEEWWAEPIGPKDVGNRMTMPQAGGKNEANDISNHFWDTGKALFSGKNGQSLFVL